MHIFCLYSSCTLKEKKTIRRSVAVASRLSILEVIRSFEKMVLLGGVTSWGMFVCPPEADKAKLAR